MTGRTVTLTVAATDTIYNLVRNIRVNEGIATEKMRWVFADGIFAGEELKDCVPLARYNIGRHSMLELYAPSFQVYAEG